jgi:hypothetical protein
MKIIVIRSYVPGIAVFVFSTVLFCIPGNQLLRDDWLSRIYFDKWVHVGLFAVLVSLWCLPVIARRARTIAGNRNVVASLSGKESHERADGSALAGRLIIVVIMAIAYGIAIEFIQETFIPNRGLSIGDMVADSIGSVVGALFAWSQRPRVPTPIK